VRWNSADDGQISERLTCEAFISSKKILPTR
jgi:hypothetical protein